MNSLSVNKKIRTPFFVISTTFVVVGLIGLCGLVNIQNRHDYLSESLVVAEKMYRSILTSDRVVRGISTDNESTSAKKYLGDFERATNDFERLFYQLKTEKENLFTVNDDVLTLLYDHEFNYSEKIEHLIKLNKALIGDLRKHSQIMHLKLFQEFKLNTIEVLDSSRPFSNALMEKRAQVKKYRKAILIGMSASFFFLLLTVFFFVYLPWKEEYQYLEQERGRLEGVIKESEIRGNTFSWEVNYVTKETRRSNHLSGIFQLDDESPVLHLHDEVKMFSKQCQDKFLIALENCVAKGEILDVQIDLSAKNKKRYWLHYYAKKHERNGEVFVVGTVRDVTQQKLAEKRFQILFDNLQLPALIFGEGQIKTINHAALTFFGVSDIVEYDKLHPAILFPLYQLDGHSSLEKLKSALDETREGSVLQQDWLFQVASGREVTGHISLFNIPYSEVDLHIMVIHDDSKRFEFERRLVDMSRKALHARRSKLEYVTQVGILLDELVSVVNDEIKVNEKVELGHGEKLKNIQGQLEFLWGENINQGLKEGSNSILTDLGSMIASLGKRWRRDAQKNLSEFEVEVGNGVDQFLWTDSIKLKLALNNLMNSAITFSEKQKISLKVDTSFADTRHGKVSFLIQTTAKDWIQSDWTILNQIENRPLQGFNFFSPEICPDELEKNQKSCNFINLVEILQGEVFFDRTDDTVGIGFSCFVERVVGLSPDQISEMASNMKSQENMISSSDIWSHFGGDWDIIENTIKDFFEYYPIAVADLYYYLREKNAEKLEDVATDFYGVITHFPFFTAIERIVRIQKYSKYLRFDKVEIEVEALSHELSVFHRALKEFLPNENKKIAV